MLTTISPSGISGVGKSTAKHSERVQTASTAESMVLSSGVSEAVGFEMGRLVPFMSFITIRGYTPFAEMEASLR
jgi:hypothetical protein